MIADVGIVGLGPVGRSLAYRSACRGLSVVAYDPAPNRAIVHTLAAWTHQIPDWMSHAVLPSMTIVPRIRARSQVRLADQYSVFPRGVFDNLLAGAGIDCRDQAQEPSAVAARCVIDCRGNLAPTYRRVRQTAYGVVVPRHVVPPELKDWLMQWSAHDGAASFLYAVPLSPTEYLLEETCLLGRPPITVSALKARLRYRLACIDAENLLDHACDEETVDFAVDGGDRARFGAGGLQMHPATGYSVGAALALIDPIIDAVEAGGTTGHHVGRKHRLGLREVYRLRRAGMEAVLAMAPEEVLGLFENFCRLPAQLQRAYMTGTDTPQRLPPSPVSTSSAMFAMYRNADRKLRKRLRYGFLKSGGHSLPTCYRIVGYFPEITTS